jgi:hypothetical protein
MRTFVVLLLLAFAGVSLAQDRVFREGFELPCTDLAPPFTGANVQSYAAWYGVPFGASHGWWWGEADVGYYAGELAYVQVRSYAFDAPGSGVARRINFPSSTGGIAASISRQCGNFDVQPQCLGVASASVAWSTETSPASFRCPLVPGERYYLNFAWFSLPGYIGNGQINPTCECLGENCMCTGPDCIATCQYASNGSP